LPPPQRTPTQTLPGRREGLAGASPGGKRTPDQKKARGFVV